MQMRLYTTGFKPTTSYSSNLSYRQFNQPFVPKQSQVLFSQSKTQDLKRRIWPFRLTGQLAKWALRQIWEGKREKLFRKSAK
jgi:hypothetical protein